MEREKQELRDYLEKDKKAMTDKMSAEEAERQRKEKEMAVGSNHSIFHSGVIEFVPLCNDQEQKSVNLKYITVGRLENDMMDPLSDGAMFILID